MKPTLDLPLDTPGLIKREIVERTDDGFVIRETWDTKIKGCPLAVLNASRLDKLPDGKL